MNFFQRKKIDQVDFFVVGAQKAGTTALDLYFREHPEIGMPIKKELHFFDDEDQFSTKNQSYKLLHSFFEKKKGVKIYGEITPIYMYWKNAISRIYNYNPKAKIIVVLRNPVERAFSHWTMEFNRGNESLSFSESIKEESNRLEVIPNNQHRIYSYVDRGLYYNQVKNIYNLFPKQSIFCVEYNDFLINQQGVLSKLYSFLEVSDISMKQEFKKVFKSEYRTSISESDKRFILNKCEKNITKLEGLLKWDLMHWRKSSQ